jgi:hypothetical protein
MDFETANVFFPLDVVINTRIKREFKVSVSVENFISAFSNIKNTTYANIILDIVVSGGYKKTYKCPTCRDPNASILNTKSYYNTDTTNVCPICLVELANENCLILKSNCCKQEFCYTCLKTYTDIRGTYQEWYDKFVDDMDIILVSYCTKEKLKKFIVDFDKRDLKSINKLLYDILLPIAYYLSLYNQYIILSKLSLILSFKENMVKISFVIGLKPDAVSESTRELNTEFTYIWYKYINSLHSHEDKFLKIV